VLEGHQDRAAPFGTKRQPLHEAHDHQQDPGPDAGLRVGGQSTDQDRRDAHHQQRADQDGFAPDPVAQVPAEDPAERAHREADAERGERQQGAGQGIAGREEGVVEVEGRGGAEADEVVGLDGGAHRRTERDPPPRRRALECGAGRFSRWPAAVVGHEISSDPSGGTSRPRVEC
jgi:hypothetical protein